MGRPRVLMACSRCDQHMRKRLQVTLDENEWQEIADLARREGLSTAQWVRQALRDARGYRAGGDASTKLEVIRAAAEQGFPTAGIGQVLDEIERGYRG